MRNPVLILSLILMIFFRPEVLGSTNDSTENIPDGVVIIDLFKPINSFSELTDYFKGKALFIDNWAPWCSPCIEEFEFVKPLHKFLKDKNIVLVYLNSDSGIELNEWVDLIKKYELAGYHLRENRPLNHDMKEKGIDTRRLPQYLIVDDEGRVLEKNALRPSSGAELYNQIEELLYE